ncbi:12662_t:CDS:2 [Acaulospora morrowiae]|uniref:12662_t:CDS:1 n=1 Tax=Acaulospora morrowiae TaxID=94023 RepID=A0A9N9GKC4_9GLOM|nr:12662_t:CDS:2 [Acaulospora morrowiae]
MELLQELHSKNLLPSLFVFDLDFTSWPLWIDCVSGPPFKADPSNPYTVTISSGKPIRLYPDLPKIFHLIKCFPDVKIGVASRTHRGDWAREVMSIMPFPELNDQGEIISRENNGKSKDKYRTFADVVDYAEIYSGTKLKHFQSLHKTTGIPYDKMIFFDDETRNKEVEVRLGVHFAYVSDGISLELFCDALKEFAFRTKD